MSKQVIGIIGPIRAGKDTASSYLSEKLSIPTFQISSPLVEICLERGLSPERQNLIALGTELAQEHGDNYLAQYLLEKAPTKSIFVGMRQLGQIDFLTENTEFVLIAIDANSSLRFERATGDPKPGEAITLDEFIKREEAENSPPNAQRLFECMKFADFIVRNEGSVEDLYAELDRIIAKL